MPDLPQFYYYLYSYDTRVQKGDAHWNARLPLTRNEWIDGDFENENNRFAVGDYFECVESFMRHQGIRTILGVVLRDSAPTEPETAIKIIRVILEKHGEFYHPARIETESSGKKYIFVLNAAVSDKGRALINKEYHYLQNLNKSVSPSSLPEVFCMGEAAIKSRQKVSMFLGQWFDGYHEFHLSHDPEAGKNRIKIWSPDGGFFLSESQEALLYRQAAKILTRYYAVDTYEQIQSWHHAAGDFIVRVTGNEVSLKLVTVRKYASLFAGSETAEAGKNTQSILEALLIFLLNTSIRMRLDRLDGTGDMVWADDMSVANCLLGFNDGLNDHPSNGLQRGFADVFFKNYLSRCSQSILIELCHSLANQYYQNSEEMDLIQNHLKAHIQTLYTSIQSFSGLFKNHS